MLSQRLLSYHHPQSLDARQELCYDIGKGEIAMKIDIYEDKNPSPIFISATWINPHTTKLNTPVEKGGIVFDADCGLELGDSFTIKNQDGQERRVVGGKEIEIIPVKVGKEFYFVTDNREPTMSKTYVYRGDFIPRDSIPAGFDVRSAIPFFFVLANDEAMRLCVVVFRSYLAGYFKSAWDRYLGAYRSECAKVFKKVLLPSAVPVILRAGKFVEVGKNQKSIIAPPEFERKKGDLDKLLISTEKMQTIHAYASNSSLDDYPLKHARPDTVLLSLPWQRKLNVALPEPDTEANVVDSIDSIL